jgi:hypothetical protein
MKNKKGQYYATYDDKVTDIEWEYFYIMYQVPNTKSKLKGAKCDEYRESIRERKKYLAKKERNNNSPYRSRIKRSRAKEAMSRV